MSKKMLRDLLLACIVGVQAASTYHVSLSRQHRESDLVAGRNSSLGTSDCQGELSALFRSLKRVGAFALKPCIATNLFSADTASLGENVVLLAVPWPHIIDSVRLLEVSPTDGRGCRAEC